MTPAQRAQLEDTLQQHGLTVVLTRDYDSILLQLARLAQFERLVILEAECSSWVNTALERIRQEQQRFTPDERPECRPMEILDIPEILGEVNRLLHRQLHRGAALRTEHLPAACAAFTGILCTTGGKQ